MTDDRGQSDSLVVPRKPPNKGAEPAAEGVEGSGLAQGNSPDRHDDRTQRRTSPSAGLERVRKAAKRDRQQRFTALLHHVYDIDPLRTAYLALKRDAAAGVDGETWRHYGGALEANLQDLAARVKRGAFRVQPFGGCTSRRRTGGSGRLAFPRWKTRSSSVLSSRCSPPSTSRSFSASRMDFDRGAANRRAGRAHGRHRNATRELGDRCGDATQRRRRDPYRTIVARAACARRRPRPPRVSGQQAVARGRTLVELPRAPALRTRQCQTPVVARRAHRAWTTDNRLRARARGWEIRWHSGRRLRGRTTGIAGKPPTYTWRQVAGAGALAGIGFTMSLFIAGHSLTGPDFAAAKVAIFLASAIAGVLGVLILWKRVAADEALLEARTDDLGGWKREPPVGSAIATDS